jgi:hypothetical protein
MNRMQNKSTSKVVNKSVETGKVQIFGKERNNETYRYNKVIADYRQEITATIRSRIYYRPFCHQRILGLK